MIVLIVAERALLSVSVMAVLMLMYVRKKNLMDNVISTSSVIVSYAISIS